MLTKKQFCEVFSLLKKQMEADENFKKGMELACPDNNSPSMPNGNIWDAVIKALQYGMEDEFDTLEWWIYSDGMKGRLTIIDEYGKEYKAKTPEELYDIILIINDKINKEATNYSNSAKPLEGKEEFGKDDIKKAFADGRKSIFEDLWHPNTETPQVLSGYENDIYPQIPCIVLGQLSSGYGYGIRYWNVTEKCWDNEEADDFECNMESIEKWAYLDDLP